MIKIKTYNQLFESIDIKSYINKIKDELKDLWYSYIDINEYIYFYYDYIVECFNNENDVDDCVKELTKKKYYIKYQDYHTGIYNVIEFSTVEDIIKSLNYIEKNYIELDNDDDRVNFHQYIELVNIDIDIHEINFRDINIFKHNGLDEINGVVILDTSDIYSYNNRLKQYKNKMILKDFNI